MHGGSRRGRWNQEANGPLAKRLSTLSRLHASPVCVISITTLPPMHTGIAVRFCSSFTEGRFRKIIIKNSLFEVYSPQFHSSIAGTFDYNFVEALSIISNRTDANVAYLSAGST